MIYTMTNNKLAEIYEAHRFNYIYKKVLGNKQLNSIYARFQRIKCRTYIQNGNKSPLCSHLNINFRFYFSFTKIIMISYLISNLKVPISIYLG